MDREAVRKGLTMYLVENNLMEMIIERTDPKYVKLYARLAPSAKVQHIESVDHTLSIMSSHKLQVYVDEIIEESPVKQEAICEHYDYDHNSNPTVLLDTVGMLHIYHPYKKRK